MKTATNVFDAMLVGRKGDNYCQYVTHGLRSDKPVEIIGVFKLKNYLLLTWYLILYSCDRNITNLYLYFNSICFSIILNVTI